MKYVACVILYHPNNDVVNNIKSYINSFDKLYIIDNTPEINTQLLEELFNSNNIIYHAFNENKGMSVALNKAFELAEQNGYDWLMTFDQDSKPDSKMILELVNTAEYKSKAAIISPVFILNEDQREEIITWLPNKITESKATITSGALINIKAWKEVGGFDERYFIDLVDTEFSYRLRQKGYKILINREAILNHSLGDSEYIKLFKWKIYYTNHVTIRRYYITRNRNLFINQFKDFDQVYCEELKRKNIKEALKILLFENHKVAKLKAIYYGYKDYKKNIFGKTNRNL